MSLKSNSLSDWLSAQANAAADAPKAIVGAATGAVTDTVKAVAGSATNALTPALKPALYYANTLALFWVAGILALIGMGFLFSKQIGAFIGSQTGNAVKVAKVAAL